MVEKTLRKNYAGIGYEFDGIGFYAPQPYPSWTKDADTYLMGCTYSNAY
jgi:hypothetical protein